MTAVQLSRRAYVPGVVRLLSQIFVVALVILGPASAARAAAPVFGAPTTLGAPAIQTGATAAAVGPHGESAVVWRESLNAAQTVWGATRDPSGGSWSARSIFTGQNVRGLSVAMTADGTAVAAWADTARSAVFVAVAPAGGSFGSPVRVATLDDPYAPGVAVVSVADDRAAVIWRTGRSGHVALYDRAFGASGAMGRVHALGGHGANFVSAAPMDRGALIAFERAGGRPAIDAFALGRDGARSGAIIGVVTEPAGSRFGYTGPRIAADASDRGVVTWTLLGGSPLACGARVLTTRPVRVAAPVASFPACGGPGESTPTASLTPDGGILGAVVAPGGATTFALSHTHVWTGRQSLAAASGWTTVPWLLPDGDGTLAVFANSLPIIGPAQYAVDIAWRPNGGRFQTTTQLGGPFFTLDAAGLSAATDGAGDVVVVWPNASGQVNVVTTG